MIVLKRFKVLSIVRQVAKNYWSWTLRWPLFKFQLILVAVATLLVPAVVLFGIQQPTGYATSQTPKLAISSLVSNNNETPKGPYLISLGGSIAAGAGLKPALPGPFPRLCGQSQRSYAVLLAQNEHLPLVQAACNGARTSSGLFKDQVIASRPLQPQITYVQPKVAGSTAVIFIGANDSRWIHLEQMCFMRGCPATPPSAFTQGLKVVSANLTNAIEDLTKEHAKVVVVNHYYTVLTAKNAMKCAPHAMTEASIEAYQSMLANLNQAITDGIKQANSPIVISVEPDFSQHGVCSSVPWVQGLHGLQPLHPTANGQAILARDDETALAHARL